MGNCWGSLNMLLEGGGRGGMGGLGGVWGGRWVREDVMVSYYVFVFEGSWWMMLLAWYRALITMIVAK